MKRIGLAGNRIVNWNGQVKVKQVRAQAWFRAQKKCLSSARFLVSRAKKPDNLELFKQTATFDRYISVIQVSTLDNLNELETWAWTWLNFQFEWAWTRSSSTSLAVLVGNMCKFVILNPLDTSNAQDLHVSKWPHYGSVEELPQLQIP